MNRQGLRFIRLRRLPWRSRRRLHRSWRQCQQLQLRPLAPASGRRSRTRRATCVVLGLACSLCLTLSLTRGVADLVLQQVDWRVHVYCARGIYTAVKQRRVRCLVGRGPALRARENSISCDVLGGHELFDLGHAQTASPLPLTVVAPPAAVAAGALPTEVREQMYFGPAPRPTSCWCHSQTAFRRFHSEKYVFAFPFRQQTTHSRSVSRLQRLRRLHLRPLPPSLNAATCSSRWPAGAPDSRFLRWRRGRQPCSPRATRAPACRMRCPS